MDLPFLKLLISNSSYSSYSSSSYSTVCIEKASSIALSSSSYISDTLLEFFTLFSCKSIWVIVVSYYFFFRSSISEYSFSIVLLCFLAKSMTLEILYCRTFIISLQSASSIYFSNSF